MRLLVLNENINKSAVNRHAVCNQLKGELSYYMLPDFVHILDRIPLTTHGKVDHKALPNATQLLENEVVKDGEISTHTSSTVSTLVELFAKALEYQIPVKFTVSSPSWNKVVIPLALSDLHH